MCGGGGGGRGEGLIFKILSFSGKSANEFYLFLPSSQFIRYFFFPVLLALEVFSVCLLVCVLTYLHPHNMLMKVFCCSFTV